MNKLMGFFMWFFLALPSHADSKMQRLEGTLYSKDGAWYLFVESESAPIKKGSIELLLPQAKKKQLGKYLIAETYVFVAGKKTECPSQRPCVQVESITPALYHPLGKRQ